MDSVNKSKEEYQSCMFMSQMYTKVSLGISLLLSYFIKS